MVSRFEEIDENQSHEIENQWRGAQYNMTSNSRTRTRPRRTQIAASYTSISSIFGNFTLKSRKFSAPSKVYSIEEEDEQQTKESYITIRPALWLARFGLKYGIQVAISQSLGNWKHALNTSRPVPDDSLIFEFCKLGNIDGVRLLLDKGDASTWDTNSQGRTPLHVAAEYIHPQLCEMLLDVGADAEVRDDKASSVFGIICQSKIAGTSVNRINVLRHFIHQAELSEPGNPNSHWWCLHSLAYCQDEESISDSRYMPRLSSFTWLMKNLKDSIDENVTASEMSLILLAIRFHWNNEDMKAVVADLSSPTRIAGWSGWTPLHYCAWFGDYIHARSLVQQSADIHSAALESLWSPTEESPTSLSLYSSAAFLAWRQILEDEKLPFEDFITQELQEGPLKSQNWNKSSLIRVFTLNFKAAVYPDEHRCEYCDRIDRQFSLVEIGWQDILQQFNPKKEIMDLIDCFRPTDDSSSFGSIEEYEVCVSQHSNDSTAAETTSYSGIEFPDIGMGPSDTRCDEAPRNCRFRFEWLCVHCWHKMISTISDIDSETDSGSYSDSDSDSGSDGDCERGCDQDCDSSSDGSPFLLSI